MTADRHYRHWSPQEERRLAYEAGTRPVAAVAASLGRTERAIVDRLRRFHNIGPTTAAIRHHGMSVADVVAALGVNPSTVRDWIGRGWLAARFERPKKRSIWLIDPYDLSIFLEAHGAILRLTPTGTWRDIVAEARAALEQRYISRTDLARLLCVAPHTFLHWRRWSFPQAAFNSGCFAGGGYYYNRAAVRTWLEAHPERWSSAAREEL